MLVKNAVASGGGNLVGQLIGSDSVDISQVGTQALLGAVAGLGGKIIGSFGGTHSNQMMSPEASGAAASIGIAFGLNGSLATSRGGFALGSSSCTCEN